MPLNAFRCVYLQMFYVNFLLLTQKNHFTKMMNGDY